MKRMLMELKTFPIERCQQQYAFTCGAYPMRTHLIGRVEFGVVSANEDKRAAPNLAQMSDIRFDTLHHLKRCAPSL
jgi:hypothetical protein